MTSSRRPSPAHSRAVPTKIRCAIYTRVSTDQGLDQEFNSLDAQREASEAYIKSQAHEGWTCLKQAYDDGGFSGGSLERPALQRLLDDVRQRKLDVIVVYKVDRLTRSLADFAKLVELFDEHGVSFVSVTQSFNTTSSMGRLTLNVLLSFAQFEREVTGERIRDKVAASKKKGLWMGGTVPYGYRLEARKLIVDPDGAETVRRIFALYLEIKSLPKLAARLAELGILSRRRAFGEGRFIGGQPFRTGALSHLLANRVYIGEVRHKDHVYPGEHAPIIERSVFEAVQVELAARLNRKRRKTGKTIAALRGLLFDSKGNRMVPVHANKQGVRYCYYQSWVLNHGQKDRAGIVSRVPAQEIEDVVLAAVSTHVDDTAGERSSRVDPGSSGNCTWAEDITRIDVLEGELVITLVPDPQDVRPDDQQQPEPRVLSVLWSRQPARRQRRIIGAAVTNSTSLPRSMRAETRSRLLKGIAQGRLWLEELIGNPEATVEIIAKRHGLSDRSVRSTLNLALLAPDIVEAAIEGQLPRGLTVTQMTDLPSNWQEQRRALGLT